MYRVGFPGVVPKNNLHQRRRMRPIGTHQQYRYLATSLEGFVQQLAYSYLRHGYYFWVGGTVPAHKDPEFLDNKILNRYPVELTKHQRAYRKRVLGEARLQYLRFGRSWILIA